MIKKFFILPSSPSIDSKEYHRA